MHGPIRYLACIAILPGLLSAPLHAKTHYVTFSLAQDTTPTSINNNGAVTGLVNQGNAGEHGFVRQPDGTVVFFDIPGSSFLGVAPVSINDSGVVTGYYYPRKNSTFARGFIRTPDGTIETFEVRHARGVALPVVINSDGHIFGYNDTTGYGFVRNPDGTTATLDCPSSPFGLLAANDSGQAAGSDNAGGVLRGADGSCTPIDAGEPRAINAEGSLAGTIGFPPAMNFLRTPDGAVTTFGSVAPHQGQRKMTTCPME